MIYKIAHTFQPEIFLPWAAIDRNIDFSRSQSGQPVRMSDSTYAEVLSVREVHVLSTDADSISRRLYGVSALTLLTEWYKRLPIMTDLFFCHITLKKHTQTDTDASPLPEQDN